jgi:plastocyanin
MRKLIVTLAVVSMLGALTALGVGVAAGSDVSAAATKNVTLGDDFFKPRKFTIDKNTIVKWTWEAGTVNDHTVTQANRSYLPKSNGFASAEKASGTYRHRFRKTGVFYVVCELHPTDMRMKIRVVD